MATKKEKLKSLLEKLNSLDTKKSLSIQVELANLTSKLKETLAVKTLNNVEKVSAEVEKFKTEFDLKPIFEAIKSLSLEIKQSEKDLLNEFENRVREIFTEIPDFTENIKSLRADLEQQIKTLSTSNITKDIELFREQFQSYATSDITEDKDREDRFNTSLEKLKTDLNTRISNIGGGSMNQKISFDSAVFSTKFADINFKSGTGITITKSDNQTTKQTDVTITAATTAPGGLTTQIQFNNAGVFAGDANLTWIAATPALNLGSSSNLSYNSDVFLSRQGAGNLRVGTAANNASGQIEAQGFKGSIASGIGISFPGTGMQFATNDTGANIGAGNFFNFYNNATAITPTTNSPTWVNVGTPTFSPTSGTAAFTGISFSPTINQTGGASGITRGLYINPTLTAAADWRAIETTNGVVIFKNTVVSSATLNIQLGSSDETSPHDIRINTNTGAIRMMASNNPISGTPDAASFQLWGNGSSLPGQAYFDSGAHNSAALVFRTALSGGGITERMRINATGNMLLAKQVSQYNGVNTAGWGIPAVNGFARSTAQTAAVASVATYTVGAADGTFIVSANVLITTSTTYNFTVTCTYTDEGNTARTLTFNFSNVAGTLATAIANAGGAVPYEGLPMHIRAKASTAITIATTGTFTSVTYNVEGSIIQIG